MPPAVLEVARILAAGPRPRRSILIALFSAEGEGLLGSRYFTDHDPRVPLHRIEGYLNLDMVGRSGTSSDESAHDVTLPDAIYLVTPERGTTLVQDQTEQVNRETVHLDLIRGYRGPRGRVFQRSDHFSFHRHGVPVVWYHSGDHGDWHRETEDVDNSIGIRSSG